MAHSGSSSQSIQTTQVWDVNEVYSTEVTSKAFKELIVRLYQNINKQALAINNKDTGVYDTKEFINGQTFFSSSAYNSTTGSHPAPRQVLRKVINFGALPNNAAKTANHGITLTDSFTFTRIYATASKPTTHNYVPIPYASSVAADIIELSVDNTHVTITTHKDMTAYTVTYVILEYLNI
jgi:hypothetical protein